MSKSDSLRLPDYLGHILQAIERIFKVDLEIVWRTIHHDLPELHEQVRLLIEP